MNLLADDECRGCFHVHPGVVCTNIAHDPGPNDTDVESVCGCDHYVDLVAQSRIVVSTLVTGVSLAPCPRCGVGHWPEPESITVRDPDDEAVACGAFHIERMSKHHVWLAVHTQDGRSLAVNLSSKSRIVMRMETT